MKILAFGASSSSQSINKQLATYAASLVPNAEVDLLDLNHFEMPIYSSDREEADGMPALAQAFLERIAAADAVIISFAEHNGIFSAAYKNVFDWASRINSKMFADKPLLLLSTSPGKAGGASVLAFATDSLPRFGAIVKASISVPSFYENFDSEKAVVKNVAIDSQIKQAVGELVG